MLCLSLRTCNHQAELSAGREKARVERRDPVQDGVVRFPSQGRPIAADETEGCLPRGATSPQPQDCACAQHQAAALWWSEPSPSHDADH